VIVTDINVEGGEKVAAQNPTNLIFQRMDVTQPADWQAVLDVAFSKFGRLDVLVNNAGTTYRNKVGFNYIRRNNTDAVLMDDKPTVEVTEDEWERVFKVNVKSIYLASHTAIPRLIQQGQGGSIINISSTGTCRPRPGLVWYNASKGAVTNVSNLPLCIFRNQLIYFIGY
jgi:NAD(P)-dependent dehydrogenase (short-subunit alcohol dehydrogenase family)